MHFNFNFTFECQNVTSNKYPFILAVDIDGKPKKIRENDRTRQCISQNILTSDNLLLHASMLKELSDSISDIESNVKLKSDDIADAGTSTSTITKEEPVIKPKTILKDTTSSPKIIKNGALQHEPVLTIRDLEQRPIQTDEEIRGSPKSVTFKMHQQQTDTTTSCVRTYSGKSKPPNILVFSESVVAVDNVKSALKSILQKNKYTIYTLTKAQALTDTWMDNALLVIACGAVSADVAPKLLNYLLKGGKLLCLCSDLIHTVLPTYKTAEVNINKNLKFMDGNFDTTVIF